MPLLMRALFLGYCLAALAGYWVAGTGAGPGVGVLVAWIGGSVFTLVFAWIGTMLAPAVPATALDADELALWDKDLAAERFAADLAADRAEQAAVSATQQTDLRVQGR